jgi:hypothetical protein
MTVCACKRGIQTYLFCGHMSTKQLSVVLWAHTNSLWFYEHKKTFCGLMNTKKSTRKCNNSLSLKWFYIKHCLHHSRSVNIESFILTKSSNTYYAITICLSNKISDLMSTKKLSVVLWTQKINTKLQQFFKLELVSPYWKNCCFISKMSFFVLIRPQRVFLCS